MIVAISNKNVWLKVFKKKKSVKILKFHLDRYRHTLSA